MALSGHLKELRNRVAVCIICFVAAFLVCLNYAADIVELLTATRKMTTIPTRRPFFIHSTLMSLNCVKTTNKTGNSNTTPKMRKMVSKKEI